MIRRNAFWTLAYLVTAGHDWLRAKFTPTTPTQQKGAHTMCQECIDNGWCSKHNPMPQPK